jgi:lipopolysaccharide heptosyltransferase I
MRILIVKLGSIGDIVHTLPAAAAIRRELPHSEITWVVEKRASAILQDNPVLDNLIEVDTKALRRWPTSGETLLAPRQQFRRLRASAFDTAIDFQGLLKSASVARLSGARKVFGFSRSGLREPASRFLLSKGVSTPPRCHIIEKNLALARGALGIKVPRFPADFDFPIALQPEHETEAAAAIQTSAKEFVILNPGGGWVTKLWGPERFGVLADQLWQRHGLHSIVTFGPGEKELAKRVESASQTGKARAASLSLKGFVALARIARLYIGGDTGPTHLAVAAGTPVVGLFGPTEWWRNGSPMIDDICIERNDIGCRVNCHRRACSKWVCMDIEVQRVLEAAEKRLARVGKFLEGALTTIDS